jgi:hypothetical protein
MSVILATQEAEIRRIEVLGQPEQIVHKTLSHSIKAGGLFSHCLASVGRAQLPGCVWEPGRARP